MAKLDSLNELLLIIRVQPWSLGNATSIALPQVVIMFAIIYLAGSALVLKRKLCLYYKGLSSAEHALVPCYDNHDHRVDGGY